MSRRLEHDEARALHLALAHRTDGVERGEHAVGGLALAPIDWPTATGPAAPASSSSLHVDQRYAALEVGRILALGEPARRLARGAAIRQHIDGSPFTSRSRTASAWIDTNMSARRGARARVRSRRSMKRSPSRDEHRAQARLGVDARGERARDRERDVLLARAAATAGARVHATVPGSIAMTMSRSESRGACAPSPSPGPTPWAGTALAQSATPAVSSSASSVRFGRRGPPWSDWRCRGHATRPRA